MTGFLNRTTNINNFDLPGPNISICFVQDICIINWDSGTSRVWPSLGNFYHFYQPIFPKSNAPKVRRGLKTFRACTLGHFG